jgi:hypothetical protein
MFPQRMRPVFQLVFLPDNPPIGKRRIAGAVRPAMRPKCRLTVTSK